MGEGGSGHKASATEATQYLGRLNIETDSLHCTIICIIEVIWTFWFVYFLKLVALKGLFEQELAEMW